MLIISKFHDYYDTVLGKAGVDKSIVYKRTTVIHELDTPSEFQYLTGEAKNYLPYWNEYKEKLRIRTGIVGFCGVLYPFVEYSDETTEGWSEPK